MTLRRSLAAVLSVGSILLATACASDNLSKSSSSDSGSASADKGAVHISGQDFTEGAIVAAMYDQLLTKAGYDTDVKLVGTRDVYMKIFPGDVDVVPEYVGGIVEFLNTTANGADAKPLTTGDAKESIAAGKSLLDKQGITLLDPSPATDTNAFFVTKDYSESNNVTKLSDLKGKSVVLAGAADCETRADCGAGLEDQYGIKISKVLPLGYASDQTYQSVIKGESQLGETSTTDGTLDAQGLVLLDDDKTIQPTQNLVPAVSSDFLKAHPDVADVLNPLMAALTSAKLGTLNAEVAVDRKKPEDVAKEFLTQEGLL